MRMFSYVRSVIVSWDRCLMAAFWDAFVSAATRIDARSCVVDRFTKSGWAEGAARVQQGKTALGGRNVYFTSPESYVRVFNGAILRSEGLRAKGVKL